jgi:uroporphyrinogen decarboxylase
MEEMKKRVGEETALYGLICGPFTLASHLRGTTIFMDMFDDPDFVKELIHFAGEVGKAMAKMYIEAGMDIIAVVDPLVSQISPKHFKEFMSDTFTDLFEDIRKQKAYSSFFVCGDATKNIEVMCQTNPDSISVDENIDILKAKEITDQYNLTIGGNIPLTTVMLHGSQMDNIKYAVDLLDQLDKFQHFILSPGCDMPYDTPVENTIGVSQAAIEFKQMKETVKDYTSTDYSSIEIDLPDYKNLKKPLIETFTLDSDSCAACTYMWGLVTDVKEELKDKIDIIEYKFTNKEAIARCIKMGVKNLPSVYINGKLAYSSIIPTKQELIDKIKETL